jgi:hypothetical protein
MDYELIDSRELARRLTVPESWVREHVRSRVPDPIPHLALGRYIRFRWGAPDLEAWLERRRRGGTEPEANPLDKSCVSVYQ